MEERKPLVSLTRKDFVITTYRAKGKGGQHRNKRDTAVRIQHPPSGAMATASESKSQAQNRKTAFRRLAEHPKMVQWLRIESARAALGQDEVERRVDRMMAPRNIRVEVRENGRWVESG